MNLPREMIQPSLLSVLLQEKTEYAAEAVSSYTGYTYLTIQPESVVLAPVYNLLRILAAIVALFLTISIIYFLPAFPFSRKTGKASEAYYSAHGA